MGSRRHARVIPTVASALLWALLGGCSDDGSNDNGWADLTDLPENAMLARTIDGDSFELTIDGQVVEARLIGVNANEGDECFGAEAAEHLDLLAADAPLRVTGDERDDFGRRLVYVVVRAPEGDFDLGAELVRTGMAVARGDHPRSEEYEAVEDEARDNGVGLWATDACGASTAAEVAISDLNVDAPGSDVDNPNGEWIELTNEGDARVSLEGWLVRDESTRHRYVFGALTLDAGERVRLFSGCGSDGGGELYWCDAAGPVWNNDGDTAMLLDPSGNQVDVWAY